jgi:alkanesulfonate monooxygenase SsuD/methylene tetrahydromethanopterin reductase-like flavin-dependent oxidoreductase (luciferase family)
VTRLGLWLPDLIPPSNNRPSFDLVCAAAETAEAAGFDSLWVGEHIPRRHDGSPDATPGFEAYSLLGALAMRTGSVRLGALLAHADRRAPSVMAKMVTGLDVISHGRAIATLRLDIDVDVDVDVDVDADADVEGEAATAGRLDEALEVFRAVLDDEQPRFSGRFYQIDSALNRPRPVQAGGVPLVVLVDLSDATTGPVQREKLRIASRHADALVVGGDVRAVQEIVNIAKATSAEGDRKSGSGLPQVIWAGRLTLDVGSLDGDAAPGEYAKRAAQELRERLLVGADGCIVSIESANPLETIARLGPVLSEAVGSVPTHPESPKN